MLHCHDTLRKDMNQIKYICAQVDGTHIFNTHNYLARASVQNKKDREARE
jgi:hypothetical protein